MKILFVCRGNVGRSQMAEAVFTHLTKGHEVRSAGTKVKDKDGNSMDGQILKDLHAGEKVINAIKEKGEDFSLNTRTQLHPEMVKWADKIVVMAEPETIPEYLNASSKAEFWTVTDPKGTTYEEHKAILDQIEVLVKKFIADNSL